jgi:hypothetical protein
VSRGWGANECPSKTVQALVEPLADARGSERPGGRGNEAGRRPVGTRGRGNAVQGGPLPQIDEIDRRAFQFGRAPTRGEVRASIAKNSFPKSTPSHGSSFV